MNNWYVITGGPSAGKTKLIDSLAAKGLQVHHESARLVIDVLLATGQTIQEVRADEKRFQEIVFAHKHNREEILSKEEVMFFDRGMQDTAAYMQLHNIKMSPEMTNVIQAARYKKVFLLEPFTFEEDYARVESEDEQSALFDLLRRAYEETGNMVEIVPAFPTKEERFAYFHNYLRDTEGLEIPV